MGRDEVREFEREEGREWEEVKEEVREDAREEEMEGADEEDVRVLERVGRGVVRDAVRVGGRSAALSVEVGIAET